MLVAGLAAAGIWSHLSHKKRAREALRERTPLAPREQLEREGLRGEALDAAVGEWERFARAYGYPAERLRVADRVRDLIQVDRFGDRGLEFEARLSARGVKELPSDLSLAGLVRLLAEKEA